MSRARAYSDRLVAVIDIGANSVRLVLYRGVKRSPDVLFNERVFCRLGEGLAPGRKLPKKAVARTLATLRRFRLLCRDMKVDAVRTVATSPLREASDGPELVKTIREEIGFEVEVVTGEREGELSALGVLSGFPGARGVMGDLGGGSLELAAIGPEGLERKVSLPLGPVRLMGREGKTPDFATEIRKALASVDWLEDYRGQPFYMVGGSWRALSQLHLQEVNWPVPVLHGYTMQLATARRFSQMIAREGAEGLKGLAEIPARRVPMLPVSSAILFELLNILEPEQAVTSAYGLREGVMFDLLPAKARADDPLTMACREHGERNARFAGHGKLLMEWIDPLYPDEEASARRLRQAICYLSDSWWNAHPDFKAEIAYFRSLVGRFVGAGHKGRAVMAIALFIAYGGMAGSPFLERIKTILAPGDIEHAVRTGLAVRLAQRLTGGTSQPLEVTRLKRDKKHLTLEVPKAREALAAEPVEKPLKALASHLGLGWKVKTTA